MGGRGAAAEAVEPVEDIKVEDAGLQLLAQRIQAEALGLQGEDSSTAPVPVEDRELDKLNVRSHNLPLNLEICYWLVIMILAEC